VIALGDTYRIDGYVMEVVDVCDGIYLLQGARSDLHVTAEQLAEFPRVTVAKARTIDEMLVLYDPGLER
jgi:hypothetical protein